METALLTVPIVNFKVTLSQLTYFESVTPHPHPHPGPIAHGLGQSCFHHSVLLNLHQFLSLALPPSTGLPTPLHSVLILPQDSALLKSSTAPSPLKAQLPITRL